MFDFQLLDGHISFHSSQIHQFYCISKGISKWRWCTSKKTLRTRTEGIFTAALDRPESQINITLELIVQRGGNSSIYTNMYLFTLSFEMIMKCCTVLVLNSSNLLFHWLIYVVTVSDRYKKTYVIFSYMV